MREIEFLPDWYRQLRRRKRMVVLHAYLTFVIAGGLGLWMFMAHRNVQVAQAALQQVDRQMAQTHADLTKLDELQELQTQLKVQAKVIAQLGIHVGASRLLNKIDALMPPQMSLLDLSLQTEEQLSAAAQASPMAAALEKQQKDGAVDRRLKMKLLGVAPNDEDVANFLAKLTSVPFFEQVAMSFTRDKVSDGHVMREFEVTFSLNLNTPGSD